MRSAKELKLCAEAVAREQAEGFDDAHFVQHTTGMAASLAWVMGEAVPSPINQRKALDPTPDVIDDEMEAALDVIYRRRAQDQIVSIPYAQGVEHTLLWVLEGTDDPPTSLD
ncbi:hypothetical protein SAMN05661080_02573 [Modestobacter sp. DSM 44400]|uniref:hypothetical protein n=1 Tax=Modestobacter sp. DSM 44400 TaxID=1550230 RepID=UPI000895DBDE|nr:hypothetical protein [Modestobacter sp. DSM 44400]SDY17661.1 hypothetical protein SAMN05661080_02573 [Modestobacter sp. DSM 44400]